MSPRLTTPTALCALLLGLMALTQAGILGQYEQTILCTMGIYMILATSLNLVNGYMGEFSCGHAGFMAVGAYTSSVVGVFLFVPDPFFGEPLLSMDFASLAFPLILASGFAAAALVGLLQASPLLRTPAIAGAMQPDPRTGMDRFTLTATVVGSPQEVADGKAQQSP